MDPTAMFIAALLLLPPFGLVACAWFSMAHLEEELRAFNAFEERDFEGWPRAT